MHQLENSVALPDHHCYRLYQNSISLRFPMKIIYLMHEKENASVKNMPNFTRSIVAFPVRCFYANPILFILERAYAVQKEFAEGKCSRVDKYRAHFHNPLVLYRPGWFLTVGMSSFWMA